MTNSSPTYKLNSGVDMPALGLGVFQSEPETTEAAVRSALEIGYKLVDTAAAYRNEEEVGAGIRASGVPREELFVTTKLWNSDHGYEETLRAFDTSLRKLQLDYLDLYLIHWPIPSAFSSTIESYKAMISLLAEGRVRAIGVSNFTASHLGNLIAETGHVPAVNQVELHPFFSQPELQAFHRSHCIQTQAWSPIGGVQRYHKAEEPSQERHDPLTHPVVLELSEKYGKSAAQVLLRWHLEVGNSPIPKSVHRERIAENFDIFDFKLPNEDVKSIGALNTGLRGGWDPDQVNSETFS